MCIAFIIYRFVMPCLINALLFSIALPTINLPGIGKFSSYKNSLQEYCQKSKVPVPQYRTRHDAGVGFIGSVSFSTNSVTAKKAMPTSKEAEMVAAFEALKQLGYFSDEVQYEHTSGMYQQINETFSIIFFAK